MLQRNTVHIPIAKLLLINAAITKRSGKTLLSSPVSHSRVSEYVPELWDELQPRRRDFGVEVPAVSTDDLWHQIAEVGISEIDLLKLDCEGAEYLILPELIRPGLLQHFGWIRGEWHSRQHKPILASALETTHAFNIDPNQPHDVGHFLAHRKTER